MDPDELLAQVNEEMDVPVNIDVVDPEDVNLIDKNARFMEQSTFQQLVENIERDGGLSSTPLCHLQDGEYTVLSGNHRIKAAREAGLEKVIILYRDDELTQDEIRAIQLSMNEVTGQDDPQILSELYDEIEDIDWKKYSGLDEAELDRLEEPNLEGLTDARLDFREISFLFLPKEAESLEDIFENALDVVASEDIFVQDMEDFDRVIKAMSEVKASYNIYNSATAMKIILSIYEDNRRDLQEGWEDEEDADADREWVPLSSLFGRDTVPVEVAQVIERGLQTMMARQEVDSDNLWQALEYLFADYNAG